MRLKLLTLFVTFLKIGAFTFGGGYAMIPLIEREAVDKHQWIERGDILNILSVAESTPGPIAINSATFVGYKVAGFWGALLATIGVVIPSFVVIIAIANVLEQFQNNAYVEYAFHGIRAGVLVLMINAICSLAKSLRNAPLGKLCCRSSPKPTAFFAGLILALLFLSAFVLSAFFAVNTIVILASAACLGIILKVLPLEMKGGKQP